MKIQIKYAIINNIENITNIYENDTDIVIEYRNGGYTMELDKEDFTLNEIKTTLNK